tara:strand:- start:456 stop:887 length:432 start_codon:yes stop_codon:yes gene_type:complete
MSNNKPQFGNAKQKIMKDMKKSYGQEMDAEYRLSGWLQVDNGWDNMSNKPVPMTPEQQANVSEVVGLIEKYGLQFSIQIQERTGAEPSDWPTMARWKLFYNKPRQAQYTPEQYAQASGGSASPASAPASAPASGAGRPNWGEL